MDEVGLGRVQSSLSYETKSKIESLWVQSEDNGKPDFKSSRAGLSTTNKNLASFSGSSSAFHNVHYMTENQGRSKNMFPPIFTCTYT